MLRENETVSVKRLTRRFVTPLRTATGAWTHRDSLVVRLRDENGKNGYGEVAPWPGFPVETLGEAMAALNSPGEANAERLPCLSAALSHARDWLKFSSGETEASCECAALLRSAEDWGEAVRKLSNGFSSFKLKVGLSAFTKECVAMKRLLKKMQSERPVRIRADANGSLGPDEYQEWCRFLADEPAIEWLEQPLPVGEECRMAEVAAGYGVADRIALDESVCLADVLPLNWTGVITVKTLLAGDSGLWRSKQGSFSRVAHASVFESAFGRQSALILAAENRSPGSPAVGFDTLGFFSDEFDRHAPGPRVATLVREPQFWDDLWERIP